MVKPADGMGWKTGGVPSPQRDLPYREGDRVGFRIGIAGRCFPSSFEAVRAAVERELLRMGDFGLEVQILVMNSPETEAGPLAHGEANFTTATMTDPPPPASPEEVPPYRLTLPEGPAA